MKTDKLKCTITERWDLALERRRLGPYRYFGFQWCPAVAAVSVRCALEIKSLYKRAEEGGSELPRWILLIL